MVRPKAVAAMVAGVVGVAVPEGELGLGDLRRLVAESVRRAVLSGAAAGLGLAVLVAARILDDAPVAATGAEAAISVAALVLAAFVGLRLGDWRRGRRALELVDELAARE